MLRITVIEEPARMILKIEGKLRGAWVKELERTWHMVRLHPDRKPVRVDLSALSFIDDRGKTVLAVMCREDRVELTADGPTMNSVIEGIQRSAANVPQVLAGNLSATLRQSQHGN